MHTSAYRVNALPDKEIFALSGQDEIAFSELYRRWSPYLESVLRRGLASGLTSDDMEDVLSITWRKVYVAIQSGKVRWISGEAFKGWLERVLKNARRDYLRWKSRQLEARLEADGYKIISINDTAKTDEGDERPLEELIASPERPEVIRQVEREEARERVRNANLSPTLDKVAQQVLSGQEKPEEMSKDAFYKAISRVYEAFQEEP